MTGQTSTARLIDGQGRIWDARSSLLAHAFQLNDQCGDVILQLVDTEGCIHLDLTARRVNVAFNPRTLSPVALCGLLYFLHDHRLHGNPNLAVCLTILGGAAPNPDPDAGTDKGPGKGQSSRRNSRLVELYRSIGLAANRIQFLIGESQPATLQRFVAQPRAFNPFARSGYFAPLLKLWRTSSGHYDRDALRPVLRQNLKDRFCLIEYLPSRQNFQIAEIGSGLRIPTPRFTSQLAGAALAGFPDDRYVNWLRTSFSKVANTGDAGFEDISAKIFWPETGLVERNYTRLLLPWTTADNRKLILSANRPMA